jgi:Putative esterase
VRFLFALLHIATLAAQDQTHFSQVMGSPRSYRVHLPAGYAASQKRYPVIYWLHSYEAGDEARDAQLAAYAAKHDAIIIDSGPAETSGNYPLYLPELAEHIDSTLRTIADRDHRGVSGFGVAGFLALWQATKAPDVVGSASALSPVRSASIGPHGFETDTVLEDLRPNHDSVRTRLFNSDADLSAALDFHLSAFASPLPKPKTFTHADPYPNFGVWGWGVVSDRRRPGVTLLENVSARGFRSAVREWLPGGVEIPEVKLTVTSPPLFPPRSTHNVTYIRLSDRKTRRVVAHADMQGRLTFELDGAECEVGIGTEPLLAISQYEVLAAPWASAGKPVKVRLTLLNKGGARSAPVLLQWVSPTPGIQFGEASARLPALAPGESVGVPVTFTAPAALAGEVTVRAADLAVEVPVYPDAQPAADFKILDESDRDGHASPGESFAIAFAEGRAELIGADPCVHTSVRIVEDSTRYTQAAIRATCLPGTIVHLLARTATRYAAIEFPVWYKLP